VFTFITSLFTNQLAFANDGVALCQAYKKQSESLRKIVKTIDDLRRLKIVASEIESKINDDENAREITLLAEELDAMTNTELNATAKGYMTATASLGALVIASLIIKKTYNTDFKNAKFLETIKSLEGWEKFKTMHVPLKRKALYSIAALALVGTVIGLKEGFNHAAEEKRLSLLLEKTKNLLKISNDLTPLKERAEAESIKLKFIQEELDQLQFSCNENLEK
jgi:hypothetical protein